MFLTDGLPLNGGFFQPWAILKLEMILFDDPVKDGSGVHNHIHVPVVRSIVSFGHFLHSLLHFKQPLHQPFVGLVMFNPFGGNLQGDSREFLGMLVQLFRVPVNAQEHFRKQLVVVSFRSQGSKGQI